MKNTLGNTLSFVILCAASVLYGDVPLPEVSVTVKQLSNVKPLKQVMTDAKGNFVVDGLSPGKYAFAFRSPKLRELKNEKFSIAISGGKPPVKQATISDKELRGGVEMHVEVGRASKIRGQVTAGGKRLVWAPPQIGSHLPGRWVEEDAAASHLIPSYNSGRLSKDTLADMQSRGTGLGN